MTEHSTTQYDVMFPGLLNKIVHEPNQILAIHNQFRSHHVWVSDQEFEDARIELNQVEFKQKISLWIELKLEYIYRNAITITNLTTFWILLLYLSVDLHTIKEDKRFSQ